MGWAKLYREGLDGDILHVVVSKQNKASTKLVGIVHRSEWVDQTMTSVERMGVPREGKWGNTNRQTSKERIIEKVAQETK